MNATPTTLCPKCGKLAHYEDYSECYVCEPCGYRFNFVPEYESYDALIASLAEERDGAVATLTLSKPVPEWLLRLPPIEPLPDDPAEVKPGQVWLAKDVPGTLLVVESLENPDGYACYPIAEETAYLSDRDVWLDKGAIGKPMMVQTWLDVPTDRQGLGKYIGDVSPETLQRVLRFRAGVSTTGDKHMSGPPLTGKDDPRYEWQRQQVEFWKPASARLTQRIFDADEIANLKAGAAQIRRALEAAKAYRKKKAAFDELVRAWSARPKMLSAPPSTPTSKAVLPMREIRFRGKPENEVLAEKLEDFLHDGWLYGYLIGTDVIVGELTDIDEDGFCTEFWCRVDPATVGQYTGLKDKNGKEVYEGDIVHYKYLPGPGMWNFDCVGTISFKSTGWFFTAHKATVGGLFHSWLTAMPGAGASEKPNELFEIVGNVIDNPELLERSAKSG